MIDSVQPIRLRLRLIHNSGLPGPPLLKVSFPATAKVRTLLLDLVPMDLWTLGLKGQTEFEIRLPIKELPDHVLRIKLEIGFETDALLYRNRSAEKDYASLILKEPIKSSKRCFSVLGDDGLEASNIFRAIACVPSPHRVVYSLMEEAWLHDLPYMSNKGLGSRFAYALLGTTGSLNVPTPFAYGFDFRFQTLGIPSMHVGSLPSDIWVANTFKNKVNCLTNHAGFSFPLVRPRNDCGLASLEGMSVVLKFLQQQPAEAWSKFISSLVGVFTNDLAPMNTEYQVDTENEGYLGESCNDADNPLLKARDIWVPDNPITSPIWFAGKVYIEGRTYVICDSMLYGFALYLFESGGLEVARQLALGRISRSNARQSPFFIKRLFSNEKLTLQGIKNKAENAVTVPA